MSWQVHVGARLGQFCLDVDIAGDEQPLALIGPNGSGKTTLLRIIAGACHPDFGEIEVDGMELFCSTRDVDLPCERRRVGYLPQGYGLFPHLPVIDNVAFGLATGNRRQPRRARRQLALRLLGDLDCSHLADRLPRQLSGGEQQRVALARALIVDPAILLLDEPLAALDATARRSVRRFLAERLRAAGRPSIIVTHDVRDALALSASICALEQGNIAQRGSIAELRAAPANDFIAEFLAALETP